MGFTIETATIGYDRLGLKQVVNEFEMKVVIPVTTAINNSVPQVHIAVDSAWGGQAADAFKNKYAKDADTVVKTIKTLKGFLESNIAKIGQNVDIYDSALASLINGNEVSSGSMQLNTIGEIYSNPNQYLSTTDKLMYGISDWYNKTGKERLEQAAAGVATAAVRTGATVGTVVSGLLEGVGKFGEAIVDTGAILGTTINTPVYLIMDGANWLTSKITGNEYNSIVSKMWDKTKAFVANDYVGTIANSFYDNTLLGNFFKNNSYVFDSARGISSGLGYTAGVVGLTILTAGIGGAAVGGTASTASISAGHLAATAAAGGFGKGTEKSWNEGASVVDGLKYGIATGAWEGTQFYIGAKIGAPGGYGDKLASSILGPNAIASTQATVASLSRIGLDAIDGAAEGFVQPALDSIYKDGTYSELFQQAGGWNNVKQQAIIGGIASTFGEAKNIGGIINSTGEVIAADLNVNGMLGNAPVDGIPQVFKESELPETGLILYENKIDAIEDVKSVFEKYNTENPNISNTNGNLEINNITETPAGEMLGLEKTDVDTILNNDQNSDGIEKTFIDTNQDIEVNENTMIEDNQNISDSSNLVTEEHSSGIKVPESSTENLKSVTSNMEKVPEPKSVPNYVAPSSTKGKGVIAAQEGYLNFSHDQFTAVQEMSKHYGDAGADINTMLSKGFTIEQVKLVLPEKDLANFENFLTTTEEGRYLDSLTPEELTSLTTYTSNEFRKINGELRFSEGDVTKVSGLVYNPGLKENQSISNVIENMDSAIAKYGGLKEDTQLFRGVNLESFTGQSKDYKQLFAGVDPSNTKEVYARMKAAVGKGFHDDGYMSTSPGYGNSFNWQPIVLDIQAPKGTPAAYINQISQFYNAENELILPRSTDLKILDVLLMQEGNSEKIVVKCGIVPK